MVPLEYLLRFIEEDAPFGDVTSEAVIPEDMKARAVIIAKQNGVIAGVEEAKALFEHFGGVKVEVKKRDGELVGKRDVILELEGNARAILLVERTALNIMGRMSGIATEVRKLVEKVKSVNPQSQSRRDEEDPPQTHRQACSPHRRWRNAPLLPQRRDTDKGQPPRLSSPP